ncbi:MAG: rhodanese-like domain-containing protein [Acidimicrobiia bacterium]|nr:rhodanese-like domain-containing protein [Acidimicrobiia bacterium]
MSRRIPAVVAIAAMALTACGGNTDTAQRIDTVAPERAAEIIDDGPEGLVVLDVRTPPEFADGHLADAILVDFNAPDFEERLAELDRSVPYVMYCRSGNRSAGAREAMRDLGFEEVYEIDGGIVAWVEAGLPLVSG